MQDISERVRHFFVKNGWKILFVFISFIIISFFCVHVRHQFLTDTVGKPVDLTVKLIVLACGCLFLLLIMVLVLFRINEILLMAGMLLALMFVFMRITPVGEVPDEYHHFYRAYEISQGSLVSRHLGDEGVGGNYLPSAIEEYENEMAEIDENDTKAVEFGNTALYAPVSYLPQVIGIKIADLFTDNVSDLFCAGRFANALTAFVLCVWALVMVPFGRKLLFIPMLFPLSLQEMISLSPDALTISLSMAFLAYILHLSYVSECVRKRDIIILALMGTVISLCKIVYVVLLLLVFMIPESKFKNRKHSYQVKLGLMAGAIIINLIWLAISAGYLVEFNEGVNSAEQVKYVLTHIPEFYATCVQTVITHFATRLPNMIGSNMGTLSITTTGTMWLMFIIFIVYEFCTVNDNPYKVHKYDCLILIGVFLIGTALIFASLYVQWTPVGKDLIDGTQGRYFTPLMGCFAFFVMFMRQIKLRQQENAVAVQEYGTYYYMLLGCFNLITVIDVIQYYIIN